MTSLIACASLAEIVAGVPNPAYRIFEELSRALPGPLISFGIEQMIRVIHGLGAGDTATVAKSAEKVMAVLLAVFSGGVLGAVADIATRTYWRPLPTSSALGVACGLVYLSTVSRLGSGGAQLAAFLGFVAWGALTGLCIEASRHPRATQTQQEERRRVLTLLGATAVATGVLAAGISRWLRGARSALGTRSSAAIDFAGTSVGEFEQSSSVAPGLDGRIETVPGTRAEVTSNADFYRIDINLTPPSVSGDDWRLEAGGMVARPLVLTLDEIRKREAVSQMVTLECISNPIGGDLIGTSRWTGVRVADLLADMGIGAGARAVNFEAADGFHESASLRDLQDPRAMLVYAMNGEPLPASHGFPLRLYIPDRHGMKLPKWIRRMTVADIAAPGFWVTRGWSQEAIPHTTAVIDTIRATGSGSARKLSVGGIAYAGGRGISKVEVQLDSGPWNAARLRTPPLGSLTWVQWRYDAPYRAGPVTARVRAYDGNGALQELRSQAPHPDGATGVHSKRATIA